MSTSLKKCFSALLSLSILTSSIFSTVVRAEDYYSVINEQVSPYSAGYISVEGIEGGQITFDTSTGTITKAQSSITSANIPEEINGVTVKAISNSVFSYCDGLTNATIPSTITYIGAGVFYNCDELESINVSEDNASYSSEDGILYNKEKSDIIKFPENKKGVYVIPETITQITSELAYCFQITSIVIHSKFESVGYHPFYWCTGLESIIVDKNNPYFSSLDGVLYNKNQTSLIKVPEQKSGDYIIPDGVTSIEQIAFNGCSEITNIVIPDSVVTIKSSAFNMCSSLTKIFIPSSVGYIDTPMFTICENLSEIEVSEDNKNYSSSNGVLFNKDMSELILFPNAHGEEYTIPNGVTSIGESAFSGCSNLTSVTIPKGVVSIGNSAFHGCSALTDITLPDTITTIEDHAFSFCKNLKNIDLGSCIEKIGFSAFSSCVSLSIITIPKSVKEIESNAFYNDNIIEIHFEGNKEQWDNVASFSSVPTNKNTTIYYNSDASNSWITVEGIDGGKVRFNDKNGTIVKVEQTVTSANIPNKINGVTVTKISDEAFSDCKALTSLVIPNSVLSIGENSFIFCEALTTLEIPENVTIIYERAFWGCKGLTSVIIPDSITVISKNMFAYCESLTNVSLGSNVKTIDECAFKGCKSLVEFNFPDNIEVIAENAFVSCTSLASVSLPENVALIGNGVFLFCYALTEINVSTNNNYYVSMDGVLFNKNKTELVQYPCAKSGDCVIPNGVTSISAQAFYSCKNLINVTIPYSVDQIGIDAFAYCDNLTDIYYCGTKEQWNNLYVFNEGVTVHFSSEHESIVGDVNLDGSFSILDIKLLNSYILRFGSLSPKSKENADINNDNVINSIDASLAKNLLFKSFGDSSK